MKAVPPPAGLTWRRPRLGDAESIFALVADYNTAMLGFADITLEDVRDELTEPGLDLDRDCWLVHDGERLVGYGWCHANSTREQADIEVVAYRPEVSRWLVARLLDRARESAAGHREALVDIGVHRGNEPLRVVLAELGFRPAATFHRMRIDHTAPVPPPSPPPGVTLATGPGDDAFRRVAHRVMSAALEGHFGYTPSPYQQWHAEREAQSTYDWSDLVVAYLDGEPVGVLERTSQFVSDERCGYVRWVGVLPSARGRGIARLLLRQAFAADAAAGRAGTILHVDTDNTTPALALYESVGMRAVLAIDIWRRVTAVSPAD